MYCECRECPRLNAVPVLNDTMLIKLICKTCVCKRHAYKVHLDPELGKKKYPDSDLPAAPNRPAKKESPKLKCRPCKNGYKANKYGCQTA